MISEQRDDGWWITDVPPGVEEMGPYFTKAQAEEDRRGVERTLKSIKWPIKPGVPDVSNKQSDAVPV